MSPNDFRRIALGLNGVVEGAHMGHPDFRAGGRIFATIHPDHASGMVKLSPGQQEKFVQDHPTIFTPENGAWGRAGCTRVRLDAADEETVGDAMTLAWQEVAKPKASASARSKIQARDGGRARRSSEAAKAAKGPKVKAQKAPRQKAPGTKQKAKGARLKAKGNAT